MDTVIRVKDLTLYYGRHLAVDHIEFEVKTGEIFGFLGPNGAGKTTTQRILTGLLPPTEGSAYVLDHDMAKDPLGAKAHIGVVPEVANPYPELSGWRNLMFTAEPYDLDRRMLKSRAEATLKDFGLWERRDDPARHYSKGMKQRLMLAMALLHYPQVLFLDEPTAGVDVESRHMIHRSVKRLGTFSVGKRKAKTGRDSRTGQEIRIPASKNLKFKPGKALKDAVRTESGACCPPECP